MTDQTQLPLARIKRIIKSDPDVKKISNDSALLMAKATELFLQYLVEKGYEYTEKEGRKILQYKDLASLVYDIDSLDFLLDIIPQKEIKKNIDKSSSTSKNTDDDDENKEEPKDSILQFFSPQNSTKQ